MSGLGDEQEVVHALQGLADTVATAVAALGLARVVRRLLRATLHLQTEASPFQKMRVKIYMGGGKGIKKTAKTQLIIG